MDLKFELYIAATPENVWQILVSPEGTRQTFFNCVIRSTFELGALLEYVGPGNDGDETVHVYGHLLAFEPNQALSFTEHPGPSYYANHDELETRIAITLEAVGECTKLTLINDRWPENHPGHANAAQTWPLVLSNIKTLAETGKTLNLGW